MIVITWSHLSILDISALVTISKNVHDPHKTVTCVLFTKKKKKKHDLLSDDHFNPNKNSVSEVAEHFRELACSLKEEGSDNLTR